jgi:RimJ/RimL family protein N-acetyltransferase
VEIRMDPCSARSRAVAQSSGYVLEGILRQSHLDTDGALADDHVFALVARDHRGE